MRSKQFSGARTRTHSREQQQRTWGSRFDTLKTPSPTASPKSGGTSDQLAQAHALSLELFGVSSKPTERRDWADDEVPLTAYTPSRGPLILDLSGGSVPGRKDATKPPHDASVFVGSLPPSTDEAEMARSLAQHLTQYAKVQNIKIVHDSKGGLCAFAQCENAIQAMQLVSHAQANPKPFMGRHLRYENARAHRSLWISYRTPFQFMPCASQDEEGNDIVVDENGVKGRWIESDLPDAMRIWKPRDARFPIVTFRSEARNIGESRFDKYQSSSDMAPAFRQKGVLFTDLEFDAQTIKKMAEAFGHIETFKLYSKNKSSGPDGLPYPPEHDTGRSPTMEDGVWEIKWGHRDDCITALNTLKRIPHLTVTWAKDSAHPQTPRTGIICSPTSSHHHASFSPYEGTSPVVRGRPFLLLGCGSVNDASFRNCRSSSSTSSYLRSPRNGLARLITKHPDLNNECVQHVSTDDDEGWTVVRSQNVARTVTQSANENTTESPIVTGDGDATAPEWTEGDFPPLKTERSYPTKPGNAIDNSEEHLSSIGVSLVNSRSPSPPHAGAVVPEEPQGDKISESYRPRIVHRRSLSNPITQAQGDGARTTPNRPKIEIPPTPELENMSLTLTPTSIQPGPETPMYPTIVPLAPTDFHARGQNSGNNKNDIQDNKEYTSSDSDRCTVVTNSVDERYEQQRQMTVDPNTIFVGGLEAFGTHSWDEARLRHIFGKYGTVQNVRVVFPASKKSGFAFVTFSDEQSAARSVREEHNTVYDGRQIRVQLRDMFPQRGGYRFRVRGPGRRLFVHGPQHPGRPADISANIGGPAERPPVLGPGASQTFASRSVDTQSDMLCGDNTQYSLPLVSSTSSETNSSTLRSSTSFCPKPEVISIHGSDSKTSVSITPPPTASSTSAQVSSAVGPVHSQGGPPTQLGYYVPGTWPSPYGAQVQYPMPVSVYGGLMQPVHLHVASTGQVGNTTIPVGSVPFNWSSVYRTGGSVAPYPYMFLPPAYPEASRTTSVGSQPTTPVKGQPPLHATGFIQGEQGTLIPVYQPEALTQYMSGSSPTNSTTRTRTSTAGSCHASAENQQSYNTTAPHFWSGFTHAPQFIAYPIPPAPVSGTTPSVAPPVSVQPHAFQPQLHGGTPQSYNSGPHSFISPAIVGQGHAFPTQQPGTSGIGSGATVTTIPPQYINGAQPGPIPVSPFSRNETRGSTPGRMRLYGNKHPPRRDLGFHNRNGRGQGYEFGPKLGGSRSPATNYPQHGPTSTSHTEGIQNISHQHQSGAPSTHRLGFNNSTPEGGFPHRHQWINKNQ